MQGGSTSAATGWTLAGIIRRHAKERGDAPAITYGERTITYRELDERSSRVAQALAAEGVRAQDRVGFIDKNGPEYFEVLFGGGKLDAVTVAVNWRLAPAEMAYIVKCPTSVDFADALPRTPSGKILKRELREPYWKGHDRRIH